MKANHEKKQQEKLTFLINGNLHYLPVGYIPHFSVVCYKKMAKLIFFSIPFGSPYLIHEDMDIAADYHGEILHYVETRVLGFKADELIVGVQSKGQKERKVTFHICADRLGVSCNCPFPGNVLCAHGYHALQDLCGHDTSFFSIFAPGNMVSIALENKDLFVTQYAKPNAFIIPAQSLGHLYGFTETAMQGLEASSGLQALPVSVRDTELVWMLVFSFFQSQRFLPMLVPVLGTLDKAGKSIKRFGKGFANIYMDDGSYAINERELFTLAKKMYLPDSQKYYFHSEDLWAGKKEIAVRFRQWNRALPILSAQPFMYKFRIAHNRFFMKITPGLSYLQRITISEERPQIQFILKDRGRYYQLFMQYLVRGIPIKVPVEDALFFVCDGTQFFLLASMRDVVMSHWMGKFHNLITILKTKLPEFEKEILERIEGMYAVVRK